jgi:hypothetical protein
VTNGNGRTWQMLRDLSSWHGRPGTSPGQERAELGTAQRLQAFEDADDISDAAGHIGEAIDADLRGTPGPSGHPRSYHATASTAHDHPQPPGPGVSDTIGSIAVTGVAAAAAIRYALSGRRKEHQP